MRKAILCLLLVCSAMTVRAQASVGTGTISTYGTRFLANFVNNSSNTLTFDYGVGILTTEGYLVPLIYRTAENMAPDASTGSVPFDVASVLNGMEGVHRLVPIARLGETAPWMITLSPRESYVEAKVTNSTISLSNKRNENVNYSLLVPTMQFTSAPIADQPTTISVKVQNVGNISFKGNLYLLATYTGQMHQEALNLAAGAMHDFSVAYTPATGGKMTFTLSLDAKGAKVVYTQTADVGGENRQVTATYWTSDTSHPQTIQTVGKLHIPTDVLAVYTDMPDAITPDAAQPNRLYFFPEDALVSTEFDNYNTVIGNRADRIVLTDGHPFATPKSFTATSIAYHRSVETTSDGLSGGWETIVLPFDVSAVHDKTTGNTLVWHKTEGDNGAFWLRRFDKVENNVLHSSPVAGDMESYRPYLIAFPGTSSGAASLAGHLLEWHAYEAAIYPGITLSDKVGNDELLGSFANESLPESSYVMNADGTAFEKQSGATASPFRAVLVSASAASAPRVTIANAEQPTSIKSVTRKGNVPSEARYGIDGRRMESHVKGIVIVGGKKVFSTGH